MILSKPQQLTRKFTLKLSLTIVLLMGIGAIAGAGIGYVLFLEVLPPLVRTQIQLAHPVYELLFVRYGSTRNTAENDILYLRTETGELYSVFKNTWSLIPPVSNLQKIEQLWSPHVDGEMANDPNPKLLALTTDNTVYEYANGGWATSNIITEEFPLNTEANNCELLNSRRAPNLRSSIKESNGILINRPLAFTARCYVLLSDNSLEVWTIETSVFHMLSLIGICLILGAGVGLYSSIVLIKRLQSSSFSGNLLSSFS